MQVAIIAGGLATRLGSLTRDLPKSLINIHGKPFIEYQFDYLRENGIKDVILCLGHLGEKIEEYCGNGNKFGVDLKYSYEKVHLDTAGALKLAGPLLADPFFTLYGDSYIFINFQEMLARLQQKNKLAAMAVLKNHNRYDKSNTCIENGRVIRYSKENPEIMEYIDYGINLFRKEILDLIPESTPYSMGTLFQQLIDRKDLLAFEVKDRFYQIGSLDGLREFTAYIGNKK